MRYSLVLIWTVILVHGQLLIPGSLADRCQPPFMQRGNECFYIHDDNSETLNWGKSRQRCLEMGADLAQPQDIVDFVKYVEENSPNLKSRDSIIWLGATDSLAENQWKWISGESVLSTMWALKPSTVGSNEPSGDGDCLNLYYYAGFFINDSDCKLKGYFVCEKGISKCPPEYWKIPGSVDRCYRLFTNKRLSWPESESLCRADGAQLAKPDDPVSLRKFIVDTYGKPGRGSWVWLGYQGNGKQMSQIPNSDPAYWPGYPNGWVTSDYCLLMLSDEIHMRDQPTKPYAIYSCDQSKVLPLCEKVI